MEKTKKKINIDELLKMMADELGDRPETMQQLALLSEKAVFEHVANKQFAMSGEQIPPKYKLLISLAVSAALGVEHCINTYTQVALRQGISKKEIVETLLVARFVKGTTVLSSSTSAFKIMTHYKTSAE